MTHWHAYTYDGRSYSDALIRKGMAPDRYPPIEIKHWLIRPRDHITATFNAPGPAISWLQAELTAQPPVDSAAFPVHLRVEYSRATLHQRAGSNVVYGYYTESRQYVSRALVTCSGACPATHG